MKNLLIGAVIIGILILLFPEVALGVLLFLYIFIKEIGIPTLIIMAVVTPILFLFYWGKDVPKRKNHEEKVEPTEKPKQIKETLLWEANQNITYHFKKEECNTYAKIRKKRLKNLRPFG
ncbi:hypothetical protein EQP59_07220 [Ornithobacterium rhinotracheale]|uniref:Uncharacterized protein n=1 Tax=Ornithobacterium rhinotracheale TaxID=28251 RepID=A0A3R5YWI1_ORNRH|nr:hypothetical protein [Ornithobacterium rhinotracheale]QAR31136.1 hypothetical protein EQP59_07220 [Ornithobacterium rhinotracheale]